MQLKTLDIKSCVIGAVVGAASMLLIGADSGAADRTSW